MTRAAGHGVGRQTQVPARRLVDRAHARDRAVGEGAGLVDQRERREHKHRRDDDEAATHHDGGRPSAGVAPRDEPADQWLHGRRDDRSKDERDHDQRDHPGDGDPERHQRETHDQAPAPLGHPVEPRRHQTRQRRWWIRLHDGDGRGRHGQQDRSQRHGGEQADDPGQLEPGREDDEHQGRVDLHGAAVERRPDCVADDHVAGTDEHEHQHDRARTERRVRDEQDDARGDDAAEVRDERSKEGQYREWHGQGDAKQHHEHVVRDRDERCQDRGAPQVAADASEGVAAGRRDPIALLLAERLEGPQPGLVTISQEEEHQERGEDPDGHRLRRGRDRPRPRSHPRSTGSPR